MSFEARSRRVHENPSLDVYLRQISRYSPLSRGEERVLAGRIRAGDREALHRLARANLRFVVSVAKRYAGRGISLSDLINEGNVGLLEAARRFDPQRGCKFISYAVWWIRQAILQALAEQPRVVRLPLNRVAELRRIRRAEERLERKFRRRPTVDELGRDLHMPPERVRQTIWRGGDTVSLDAPVGSGPDTSLVESMEDRSVPSPEAEALAMLRRTSLGRALRRLRPREREIVSLYFGLHSERTYTLEEIGRQMGLTRERVRQLKERALGRLRTSTDAARLQALLN